MMLLLYPHGKPARSSTNGFYARLVIIALVLENFSNSTGLVMDHGFSVRSRFCNRRQQYHCQERFHSYSQGKSRLPFQITKARSDRNHKSWSIPASVTDLFEVLDEESDGIDDDDSNDDSSIEEEQDEEMMVSDAEALLACWSFLKRRKRLGDWTEHEERKAQKVLSRNYFLTDDGEGYSLLDYDDDDDDDEENDQNNHNNKLLDDEDGEFDFDCFDDNDSISSMPTVEDILSASSPVNDKLGIGSDGDDEDVVAQDLLTISSFVSRGGVQRNGEKEDIDLWHTEFTSFPTEPNPSRTRRVDAMKRRWEDPDYRKRWYEKRWGSKSANHPKDTQLTDRERQAVQRARALPTGFLGSEELASMTEDEIAEAIRTRMRSTRKRVASRKETLQRRRDMLNQQIESLERLSEGDTDIDWMEDEETRQVLFSPTEKALKEAQWKRSQRAKKLYATRLENQKREQANQSKESLASSSKPPPRKKGPYFPPKQPTPQDAFLRIENDLDHGTSPSIDDVRLVLRPGKMKNRKLLLCRILEEQFDLTGKCVPLIPSKQGDVKEENSIVNYDEHDLAFVKTCTIARLGNFVLYLLKNADLSV